MRDPKRKQVAVNTSVPTDEFFDEAVREGKEILAQIDQAERGQFRLGALAHQVKTKYNDRSLARFAKEIGIAKCTLERYRTVYRAWEGKLAPGPISTSYAVLRELATHPEREQIIRKNPDLTKREAHELMRKREGAAKTKQEQEQEQEDEWLKHDRKWFKDLVAVANEASRVAGVLDEYTPEQLDKLRQAVDPKLLMYVRGGGRMLFRVANRLAELLGDDLEEASAPIERPHPEATAQVAA
jgi:hypothetical protein